MNQCQKKKRPEEFLLYKFYIPNFLNLIILPYKVICFLGPYHVFELLFFKVSLGCFCKRWWKFCMDPRPIWQQQSPHTLCLSSFFGYHQPENPFDAASLLLLPSGCVGLVSHIQLRHSHLSQNTSLISEVCLLSVKTSILFTGQGSEFSGNNLLYLPQLFSIPFFLNTKFLFSQ